MIKLFGKKLKEIKILEFKNIWLIIFFIFLV